VKDDLSRFRCIICDKLGECQSLSKHENTSSHQENAKKIQKTSEKSDQLKLTFWEDLFMNQIRITAFIVNNNLPLSIGTKLVDLIQCCFSDSKLASQLVMNDKIIKNVCSGISEFLKSQVYQIISTKPFSLLVDETTDCSNKKQL